MLLHQSEHVEDDACAFGGAVDLEPDILADMAVFPLELATTVAQRTALERAADELRVVEIDLAGGELLALKDLHESQNTQPSLVSTLHRSGVNRRPERRIARLFVRSDMASVSEQRRSWRAVQDIVKERVTFVIPKSAIYLYSLAEMNLEQIIRELKSERERIDSAIRALEGGAGARSNGPRSKQTASSTTTRRKRGPLSPAARKRLSEQMKKRWAERKAAAAKK